MTTLMRLTASFILVAQAVTATTIARAGEDKAAARWLLIRGNFGLIEILTRLMIKQ